VVSFDVRLAPTSTLEVELGSGSAPLVLSRPAVAVPSARLGSRGYTLTRPSGWLGGGWRHVEATTTRLAIDGRELPVSRAHGATLAFRAIRGRGEVSALIVSAAADRASLVFHRLAELHARVPVNQFPEGADVGDQLHYDATWTNGFWAGSLWQAAAIEPAGGMFARWALAATVDHFGQERSDTHDVGFMYGQTSLAAWRALCRGSANPSPLCPRLQASVLSAARELVSLASTNPGAGTVPTNSTSPSADTIVDSMMNIAILTWASRVTGNPSYARLASHHAHVVASLLVRGDGSTAQSVHFDRSKGQVLYIHSHQGLSNASTWSRGQAWAVYGFAQTAADLHDRALLAVAQHAASYVALHLPASGVPPWDYDAPAGAAVDVSAGVITAAGLLHLAAACRELPGVCDQPARWTALARKMLAAAIGHASDHPPIGFLGDQVLNERGSGCWCDGGELIFGLTYALEARKLLQGAAG
jgi:unsaturated chondroitin disaccharide hydrolase